MVQSYSTQKKRESIVNVSENYILNISSLSTLSAILAATLAKILTTNLMSKLIVLPTTSLRSKTTNNFSLKHSIRLLAIVYFILTIVCSQIQIGSCSLGNNL